ncbi:MAG: transketolase family protein, partial [Gemmatimonadota bacterium]|nr:transketolase family protein [Gemmatimonadota bacterium]
MTTMTTVEPGEAVAMRDAWGAYLVELGHGDERLVVLDGDLANSTKADLFAAAHPERFFEMGIAEQNMLGVAAGLATIGYVPWISTFAAFLAKRALDQIRVVIAQPGLNVKMCGAYSGLLTGKTGKTHQAMQDLTVFRAMPGIVTIAPADAVELRGAMRAIMDDPRPTYLRVTRDPSPTIFSTNYGFEIGKAVVVREGEDIGIISTGVQTVRAIDAARFLQDDGVSAAVLHVPTLKPLDTDAILTVAARTGAIVVTEDHSILGGLGG